MPRRKYRLRKEEGNFINLDKEEVSLNIPVTETGMTYQQVERISSEDINAILVRIQGGPNNTPDDPVIDYISENLSFKEINIEKRRFERDPYLLVVIFNNMEELTTDDIECFKQEVEDSRHYSEAEEKVRYKKRCQKIGIDPFQPREQDGDVIGGNQKK